MIQFNLLPDVKKEYIKARRQKQLIMTLSFLSVAGAIFLTFMMFSYVQFVQKESISDLEADIDAKISEIESIPDLEKILTVQSQLDELNPLHEGRPEMSRIIDYLQVVTPTSVKIANVSVSLGNESMEISGSADSLASVNQYADTLKFATYRVDGTESGKPFTNVLTQLSRDQDGASYTISMKFDPVLFDNTKEVVIVVPNTITTRSSLGDLFEALPEDQGGVE